MSAKEQRAELRRLAEDIRDGRSGNILNPCIVIALLNEVAGLEAENELLKDAASQMPVNSPSQICQSVHIQNCNACEDATCGDNETPSIAALKARIADREAKVARLESVVEAAVEKFSDAADLLFTKRKELA